MYRKLIFGIIFWVIFCVVRVRGGWASEDWVVLLLLQAPMLWIPLWTSLMEQVPGIVKTWLFPAGILFGMAFVFPENSVSPWISLPWLGLSIIWTVDSLTSWALQKNWQAGSLLLALAPVTLVVGAAWASMYSFEYFPIGFPPIIVLLTAAHFHYLGFLLFTNTGKLLSIYEIRFSNLLTGILLTGITLTAIGITISQLKGSHFFEVAGALLVVISGIWIGWGFIQAGIRHQRKWRRYSWLLGGSGLVLAMGLAFMYGLRYFFTIPFLSIPFMYQVHGSLNVIAVGALLSLGWAAHYFD